MKHISNIRGSLSSPSVLGHSKSATRNMPFSKDKTATRPHLIIIDADYMKVKFLSVLGNVCIDGFTFSNLNKRPNRLSRINEDSFALIYENNLDIAIFNIIDNDLILTRTVKVGYWI
jgi:hypothetical protein